VKGGLVSVYNKLRGFDVMPSRRRTKTMSTETRPPLTRETQTLMKERKSLGGPLVPWMVLEKQRKNPSLNTYLSLPGSTVMSCRKMSHSIGAQDTKKCWPQFGNYTRTYRILYQIGRSRPKKRKAWTYYRLTKDSNKSTKNDKERTRFRGSGKGVRQ
jgi:hypothetical protein